MFSLPGARLKLMYSLCGRRKEEVRGRATGLFRTKLVARFFGLLPEPPAAAAVVGEVVESEFLPAVDILARPAVGAGGFLDRGLLVA